MRPSNPFPPTAPHEQLDARWQQAEAAWGGAEPAEPEVNFMEYVLLVWQHRWTVVAVVLLATTIAAVRAFSRPKMYRSVAKISLEVGPQVSQSNFDNWMNFWQLDRYVRDQIEILSTWQLASRAAARLGLAVGGDDAAVHGLLANLEAKQVEQTDIIEISMVGLDPVTTAEWLNVYIEEFIAANIENSLGRTRQVYEVIQSRLEPLRRKVHESEGALLEFREREDALLFAEQDKNVITEQVNTLTTQYAQAKADRITLETKLGALRQLSADNLATSGFPEIMQDASIVGLRQQRDGAQLELANKLRELKEGHPQVKELRLRIASLDERIEAQIATVGAALRTDFDIVSRRERSLYDNIQQLKDQSITLSKQTLELDSLRRDYEQNKQFFEDMLARSKEADLSTTSIVNNIRIIEAARPASSPYSPNVPRTIAIGLALGLFLGVGLVLGLDFLDHTIRTPDQVERYAGVETIGTLPRITEESSRVLRESFQSIRTALMLAARGEGCQILLVTSAVPSEGKTTVSFNIAKVLAGGGAKVLLIDGDLRKPRLHHVLEVKNTVGLTSVVLGEVRAADVVVKVPDAPTLDVLVAGPLPPNPPELFGKSSFRRLLDESRDGYDWVVIDSPPVASVTDPVICSALVDMAVVVIQYGHARRHVVADAVKSLARSGVRIAGAILNRVDLERDRYYYSYYYSYSKYGGYGDEGQGEGEKA